MGYRAKTIQNKASASILFAINIKETYASEIARILNKAHVPVIAQLNTLEKEGYIIQNKNSPKLKNKKLYSVNFDKLTSEFVSYLKNRKDFFAINSKNYNSFSEALDISLIVTTIMADKKQTFFNNLEKNNTLKNIFKEILADEKIKKADVIEDIFKEMITCFADDINKINKKTNKEFYNLSAICTSIKHSKIYEEVNKAISNNL